LSSDPFGLGFDGELSRTAQGRSCVHRSTGSRPWVKSKGRRIELNPKPETRN